jgi:hypothetical protein
MSDVKVTPAHRRSALTACGWSTGSMVDPWVDVGGDTFAMARDGGYLVNLCEENAVALAIATAEHNVLSELRALLERSEFIGRVDYVQADSIRNLIVHLGGSE